MNYTITKIEIDEWKIVDTEGNYLKYFYSKELGLTCTSVGEIDKRFFEQGSFKTGWKQTGRGRISNITIEKLNLMNDYFYKNYKKVQ